MQEYHKIQTVFKRNPETKYKTLLMGEYSMPEFEYLKDNTWVYTEKVDGTNIRVIWNGQEVIFNGKTDNAQIPAFLLNKLQNLFTKERMVGLFDSPITLYGEGFGARIQRGGGNYIPDGVDFALFDVRCGYIWLERANVEDIANKLGLQIVPIIGYGTLSGMIAAVREGFKSQWGDFMAEGIVARPTIELANRMGHRIITKIKHKDFNTDYGR